MTGTYYVDAADWLRSVGLTVVEGDGSWKRRARSSGGFAATPLGIQWHHTASQTTPANDIAWQTTGSSDAPIGNATIMRDGSVWMVAAGAANTAGKGGPVTLSRGTVPTDGANTRTWAFEVANNGVGEAWPQIQVDAYFAASNEMNRRFGNAPSDVFTHALGTGNGWTSRKIDPATAAAVQGPWRPRSVTGSGTWSLDDICAECVRRAGLTPPAPTPPDNGGDDDMPLTDDDIDRIATAVWRRLVPLRTGQPGETRQAAELLGWAHANAEQANQQIVAHRGVVEGRSTGVAEAPLEAPVEPPAD